MSISGKTYLVEEVFRMLGAMVGRAIIDERTIDFPLAEPFW